MVKKSQAFPPLLNLNVSSPSGIAEYDWHWMQFTSCADNIATNALPQVTRKELLT